MLPFDDDVVKDRKGTVFWISLVYGVAVMSPFNAVLSTLDFFEDAMPGYPISFVVSFAINGIMVFVVMVCIAYPEKGSHGVKISLMFLVTSAILVAIPYATDLTSSKAGPGVSFYVIVGVLCLLGGITAISQSAVFAYMSVLPERYMAICSTGFGVSGIL